MSRQGLASFPGLPRLRFLIACSIFFGHEVIIVPFGLVRTLFQTGRYGSQVLVRYHDAKDLEESILRCHGHHGAVTSPRAPPVSLVRGWGLVWGRALRSSVVSPAYLIT